MTVIANDFTILYLDIFSCFHTVCFLPSVLPVYVLRPHVFFFFVEYHRVFSSDLGGPRRQKDTEGLCSILELEAVTFFI